MLVKVFESVLEICFRCLMDGYTYQLEFYDVDRCFLNSSWAVLSTAKTRHNVPVEFSEGCDFW